MPVSHGDIPAAFGRADKVEAFRVEQLLHQIVGGDAFLVSQVLEGSVLVVAVAVPALCGQGASSAHDNARIPGGDDFAEFGWEAHASVYDPADVLGER